MQKRVYQTRKKRTNHRTYLQNVDIDFHLPQNQKSNEKNKQLLRASGYHTKIDSYKSSWMGILERVLESSIKKKKWKKSSAEKERKKKEEKRIKKRKG